jgi:hypothetical protein
MHSNLLQDKTFQNIYDSLLHSTLVCVKQFMNLTPVYPFLQHFTAVLEFDVSLWITSIFDVRYLSRNLIFCFDRLNNLKEN